ncbi:MAG: hypothetical protein ACK4IY_01460 [Chitinophagales bacterium]
MQIKKIAGFLIVITLMVVACSPEIKLENTLTKDGGRWNIDEVRVVSTTQLDPPVVTEFAADNQGEILFYESGSGILISLDTAINQLVADYFEWENTASTILLNFEDGLEQEYNIEEKSKDEQVWTREESIVNEVTNIVTVINTQITISRVNEISNK